MNILCRTPFYAAAIGAALTLLPVQAADSNPALKKNADILQTILQTAFKDSDSSRLSSLQYSYLAGQGLLFQANAITGGRHGFSFRSAAPAAPIPPLPGAGFEFEFDHNELEKLTEAAQDMAEQIQDQHRQSYRVMEQQRAIERELRDVERDKRDIEFNKSLTKLDKDQQQELQMLQQKTKQLQEKLAAVTKEATLSRQQLEERRAKQVAEQQQQMAAMVKTVGEKFSQVLCDYGASLRDMPDNEHITLQINGRSNEGRYYWVIKKADINQCMTGKIKAKDLLTRANSYQF